jgi:uncharacterized cupredoxin-like copper-binding protein
VLTALAVLGLAACGGGGSDSDGGGLAAGDPSGSGPGDGARTVEVDMVDNAFSPSTVEVADGETVRFVFTNEGDVRHDAVIGDEAAQAEHEDEMRSAGTASGGEVESMDHGAEGEGSGGGITLEPGETGELAYTSTAGGEVLIGCHEPGHYDAGMRLSITRDGT